jgi:hypothetical protein
MEIWIFLLLFTVLFIISIVEDAKINRCPYKGGECFDGNGKFQYKGRGYKDESVDRLLNRIDWLAKNSNNKPLYTTSYIIAYVLSLAVLMILYASGRYLLNVWEYILIIIISFVIVFSLINLSLFHTDKYPQYYIRQNIRYISKQLNIKEKDPGYPSYKSKVPHRTKIDDILN